MRVRVIIVGGRMTFRERENCTEVLRKIVERSEIRECIIRYDFSFALFNG